MFSDAEKKEPEVDTGAGAPDAVPPPPEPLGEAETADQELKSSAGAPDADSAPPEPLGDAETADQELRSSAGASESDAAQPAAASDAEAGEPAAAAGPAAAGRRVPTWVWVALGVLGAALVAVTLALFVEARDTADNANAAAEASAQLLDDLVADVETTNDELKEFNDQFAAASSSAQAKASEAQGRQSQRSSSNQQSP